MVKLMDKGFTNFPKVANTRENGRTISGMVKESLLTAKKEYTQETLLKEKDMAMGWKPHLT